VSHSFIFKALNLPLNTHPDYRLLYPMRDGELNNRDYSSFQAVIGDLQVIWTESIKSELEIEDKDFRVSSFLFYKL
jgi:actin-related protein 8